MGVERFEKKISCKTFTVKEKHWPVRKKKFLHKPMLPPPSPQKLNGPPLIMIKDPGALLEDWHDNGVRRKFLGIVK